MTAIYRRELRGLFDGLLGWGLVALWLLLGGWFTLRYNLASASSDLAPVLQELSILLIVIAPFLAAHCFTRDNQSGNILWLRSLPVGAVGLTLGKYLAALTVFAIPTVFYAVFPPLFANYGTVSYGSAYTALVGYFLLGAAWLAVCCLISSRMRHFWVAVLVNVLVGAAVYALVLLATVFSVLPLVGFLICLLICVAVGIAVGIRGRSWLAGSLTGGIPAVLLTVGWLLFPRWIAEFIGFVALFSRFEGFCSGYFDLSAAVLYLSVVFLAMFFAVTFPLSTFQKGGKKQ